MAESSKDGGYNYLRQDMSWVSVEEEFEEFVRERFEEKAAFRDEYEHFPPLSFFDVLEIWLIYDKGLTYCPTWELFLENAIRLTAWWLTSTKTDDPRSESPFWRGAEMPYFEGQYEGVLVANLGHPLLTRARYEYIKFTDAKY